MRTIRLSKSFAEEFDRLLAQGEERFGLAVVDEKRALVRGAIAKHLAYFPRRPVDSVLGICTYHVTDTPFVLLYDYDDAELRVHLVVHGRSDWSRIDLSAVEW